MKMYHHTTCISDRRVDGGGGSGFVRGVGGVNVVGSVGGGVVRYDGYGFAPGTFAGVGFAVRGGGSGGHPVSGGRFVGDYLDLDNCGRWRGGRCSTPTKTK